MPKSKPHDAEALAQAIADHALSVVSGRHVRTHFELPEGSTPEMAKAVRDQALAIAAKRARMSPVGAERLGDLFGSHGVGRFGMDEFPASGLALPIESEPASARAAAPKDAAAQEEGAAAPALPKLRVRVSTRADWDAHMEIERVASSYSADNGDLAASLPRAPRLM